MSDFKFRHTMRCRNDISRVMCRPVGEAVSVIYLAFTVACKVEQPTPRQRTGHPCLPVYLALQHMGGAAADVATGSGGLLPHLFTLTLSAAIFCRQGGFFLSP